MLKIMRTFALKYLTKPTERITVYWPASIASGNEQWQERMAVRS